MDLQTRQFFSAEMEKLASSINREFTRIGTRLEAIESRIGSVDLRLATLEERGTHLENRLGRLEHEMLELHDLVTKEMSFTSDFRDELSKRVDVLEAKAA